jgi:YfiH family protein
LSPGTMNSAPAFVFDDRDGLVVGRWPALSSLGIDALVTTRLGGVSDGPYGSLNLGLHVGDDEDRVIENRRRALRGLGATLDEVVFAEQVHGPRASLVGPDQAGCGARRLDDAVRGTDSLVTETPGLVLAILVADCVPIVLADPEAGVLAVVHAGWRGTAGRVVVAALEAARARGADPPRIHAALGPSVPEARYRVGSDVAKAVAASVGTSDTGIVVEHPDGPHLDLVRANELQLQTAGVAPEHIVSGTPMTDDQRFFSDRRARPCGRFALLARLRP